MYTNVHVFYMKIIKIFRTTGKFSYPFPSNVTVPPKMLSKALW